MPFVDVQNDAGCDSKEHLPPTLPDKAGVKHWQCPKCGKITLVAQPTPVENVFVVNPKES